ncbi:MAG: OmpA family protein [Rhodospirillaceae bacterium]
MLHLHSVRALYTARCRRSRSSATDEMGNSSEEANIVMLKNVAFAGSLNRTVRIPGTTVLIAAAVLLAGCSSVPDAVNPAEWYKSTVELFSGNDSKERLDDETQQAREKQVAEAAGVEKGALSYPSVSGVERQRQSRNLGLAADPDRPHYAPSISRQGEDQLPAAASAAPSPPPAITAPAQPMAQAAVPQPPQPSKPMLKAPKKSLTPTARSKPKLALTVPGVPQVGVPTRAQQEAEYAEHQNRMQKHLAEILAASGAEPEFVRPSGMTRRLATGETIVIGGTGLEAQDAAEMASPDGGAANIAGDQGAWPLPPGAQRVATIVFPNGSSRLTGTDRRILAQVAALQKERGGTIRVVGHSSSRTRNLSAARHQAVNYNLSAQRAQVVAKELVRQGANRRTVLTAALSDSRPLYREIMPNGEAGNRRTEIYLVN